MISKETEAEIVRLFHGEKWPIGTIATGPTAWSALRSSAPTPTAPSRSRWTRCRCCAGLPPACLPPRFHTVEYAGVLAPASAWRARLLPKPPPVPVEAREQEPVEAREQEPVEARSRPPSRAKKTR
jgi:hypothetical protein